MKQIIAFVILFIFDFSLLSAQSNDALMTSIYKEKEQGNSFVQHLIERENFMTKHTYPFIIAQANIHLSDADSLEDTLDVETERYGFAAYNENLPRKKFSATNLDMAIASIYFTGWLVMMCWAAIAF